MKVIAVMLLVLAGTTSGAWAWDERDAPPAPPTAAPGPAPSGPGAPIGDMREEFQKLSRQQPRNPAAERAFIESKIELARGDPRLSEAEKVAIIAELQRLLEQDHN